MAAGDGSKDLTDGTIEGLHKLSSERLANVASLRLSQKDTRQIEPLSFLEKKQSDTLSSPFIIIN